MPIGISRSQISIQAKSTAWSSLQNATAALTLANDGFATTFNQTSAVAWTWANTTAATSGTSQSSPTLSLKGQYWTGAASAEDKWTTQNVVANGTNGTSVLTFSHTGTTGAASLSIPGISSNLNFLGVTTTALCIKHSTVSASTPFGTGFGCLQVGAGGVDAASFQGWAFGGTASNIALQAGNSNSILGWSSGNYLSAGVDTALTRQAAGIVNITTGLSFAGDSGMSRLGPASLGIGTGAAGNIQGNLQLNTISSYGGTTTVAQGMPSIIAIDDKTAQAAAIGATNLTASAPRSGRYRVGYSATVTTVDGVSSILGGTNGFQVIYTSPTDSVAKTTVPGNSITSAGNTTATADGGDIMIYAKTGTAIQYKFDYTSNTPGQMIYELHVTLEAL